MPVAADPFQVEIAVEDGHFGDVFVTMYHVGRDQEDVAGRGQCSHTFENVPAGALRDQRKLVMPVAVGFFRDVSIGQFRDRDRSSVDIGEIKIQIHKNASLAPRILSVCSCAFWGKTYGGQLLSSFYHKYARDMMEKIAEKNLIKLVIMLELKKCGKCAVDKKMRA